MKAIITIYANLKTGERCITTSSDPDDQPITVFTKFLLPDIAEKIKQRELAARKEHEASSK